MWGFEDPRVVRVDELNTWAITCTAYGPTGPAVRAGDDRLQHGAAPRSGDATEDKNASLFPRRINGDWVLIHRPVTMHSGPHTGGVAVAQP